MPSAENRACITGRGVFAAGGTTVDDFWKSAIDGQRTASLSPILAGLKVNIAHAVNDDDLASALGGQIVRRVDRSVQLGLAAANAAIADAGDLGQVPAERIGIVVGNSLAGVSTTRKLQQTLATEGEGLVSPTALPASINNMLAGYIALKLGIHGSSYVLSTACASGTDAIGIARQLVEAGQLDVVIAGGSEAPISPEVVAAFTRMGATSTAVDPPMDANRPFSQNRSGFSLGEGSGIVVVETLAHTRKRGATPYVVIAGYGSTNDAFHETSPDESGQWYEAAIRRALDDAGVAAKTIDYWNMHGTGTVLNDRVESAIASKLVGREVAVGSTKPLTGHCLGATGALEAILCSLAITEGTVPPSMNSAPIDPDLSALDIVQTARKMTVKRTLSTSLGFGGHNAALILEAV